MDSLPDMIVESFGLNAESVVKEKSYYIITTESGRLIAKKNSGSEKHIMFQHKVKEHLFIKGFNNTDRFLLSCDALPYAKLGGDLYVLSQCTDYRESNFTHQADVLKVAEILGSFHSMTEGYDFTEPDTVFAPDIIAEYKKGITFLQSVKKSLSAQKGLSDIDVAVVKNYEYYLKRAKSSVALLQKTDCGDLPLDRTVICHNLVKDENFLIGDTAHMTEFSKISAGHPVIDICKLMQRVLKSASKNAVSDILPAELVLNSYSKFGDLDLLDVKTLYANLKYPHNFIKACTQYYSKKRAFVPASIKNRFDLIIESRKKEEQYMEQILALYS